MPWAKKDQTTKQIDIQKLFNTYWTSKEHELVVSGQSGPHPGSLLMSDRAAEVVVIGKHTCTLEFQFSANPTVRPLHCPSRPANNVRVGGVLALFAQ